MPARLDSGVLRLGAVMGTVVLCIVAYVTSDVFMSPTDAYVYLAAGERLNAGHDLYAIGPGDRFIGLNPPFWTVPTLSPPLLGVLWQPLALLGVPGMLLGWALAGVAYFATVAVVAWRSPMIGLVFTTLLVPFIGWQIGLGNVNGFLALGILLMWLLRDRPWVIGSILAVMISIKVVPIVLGLWLLATKRYQALVVALTVALGLLAFTVLTTGLETHLVYIDVVQHAAVSGQSVTSLTGLLVAAGVPDAVARLAPWAVLVVGAAAMWHVREREKWAFPLAVTLMLVVSPTLQPYWLALLITALAPLTIGTAPTTVSKRVGAIRARADARAQGSGRFG